MHANERWRRVGGSVALGAASDGWRRLFRVATRRLRREPVGTVARALLNVLMAIDRRLIQFAQNAPLTVTMRNADDTAFCYPFADLYWTRSGFRVGTFEPELPAFLVAAKSIDYAFIDCGANFGLWSAVASSPMMGSRPAVAVEASPISFRVLSKTRALNDDRFAILNRAVSARDGEVLEFGHSLSHAASHVVTDAGWGAAVEASRRVQVQTISIDGILQRYSRPGQPVLVKLDVEGHELEALEGGSELGRRPAILFYEEHGADEECRVTRYLHSRGWTVFWPETSSAGELRLSKIDELDKLKALKVNPHFGYNLFALPPSGGGVWGAFVEGLIKGGR